MTDQPAKHGNQHGPLGPDPIRYAEYHYVVRRFNQRILVQSPAGVFHVTRHMDGYRLIDVEAAVVTVGGADLEIQIRNATQAVDMLTNNLFVDAGDHHSKDSASPATVTTNDDALVEHGDQLWIEVLDSDDTMRGLDVVLLFI